MTSANHNDYAKTRSILVTDSGLGGLSVFNEIANRLEKASPWEAVKLVYVNAWPAPHRGYNHFDTPEKRARVFNNALNAMAEFDPDEILIACNTLSVIYPHTEFCASSGVRVTGIVDHGVQMVHEKLAADPDSVAIILGTPTTIDAKTHATALEQLGIPGNRIINIGCTNLAGWIEREPFSQTVQEMIAQFVQEAALKLDGFDANAYAALCCTHFGYRQELFEQAFSETVAARVTLLNPNIKMAQQAVPSISIDPNRSFSPQVEMQIVSKAEWSADQVRAYEKLLPDISSATRHQLNHYRYEPNLFSVD